MLLTKVQRHVRFKQYVITLRSCRPIVHRLRYLLPHVIVIGVNTSASQPSSSASAGDPTPASSLWDKLNAAKSSNTLLASSATHDAASRLIMRQQLATYLAEPTLLHSHNPLSWWATNRQKYPSVQQQHSPDGCWQYQPHQLQASVCFPRPGM